MQISLLSFKNSIPRKQPITSLFKQTRERFIIYWQAMNYKTLLLSKCFTVYTTLSDISSHIWLQFAIQTSVTTVDCGRDRNLYYRAYIWRRGLGDGCCWVRGL